MHKTNRYSSNPPVISSFFTEVHPYGFNGKERDNEGMGGGSSTYDYGFRIYNPALGKFLSVDPLCKGYPWYSPYQFAGNIPTKFIDLDGKEPAVEGEYNGEIRVASVQNNEDVEGQLFYWVWEEQEVRIPYLDAESDWVSISVRPVEIVGNFYPEKPYVPAPLRGTEAETAYLDARLQSDIVESPQIASAGSLSGIGGGRFGCTRFGGDPKNKCSTPGRKYHDGTDILSEPGEPMRAAYGGEVIKIETNFKPGEEADDSYGNFIKVRTFLTNGLELTLQYCHLDGVGVKEGTHVNAGEVIGTTGSTGNAAGVAYKHVHIVGRLSGRACDPEDHLCTKFGNDGQPINQDQ